MRLSASSTITYCHVYYRLFVDDRQSLTPIANSADSERVAQPIRLQHLHYCTSSILLIKIIASLYSGRTKLTRKETN